MDLLCFHFTRKSVATRWSISSSFFCSLHTQQKKYIPSRYTHARAQECVWNTSKKRDLIVPFIYILFVEMIRVVNRNKRLNAWHIWQDLGMQILDTGCCYCKFQLASIIITTHVWRGNSELKKRNGWHDVKMMRRGETLLTRMCLKMKKKISFYLKVWVCCLVAVDQKRKKTRTSREYTMKGESEGEGKRESYSNNARYSA